MSRRWLLILGSNHQRARGLRLASRRLREDFDVLACSRAIPTRDARTTARYLNAACVIVSSEDTDTLKTQLRKIESAAGRDREAASCALDIDLVAVWDEAGFVQILKPDDLRAAYAQPLLRALQLEWLRERA